jgi:hypothetical protein
MGALVAVALEAGSRPRWAFLFRPKWLAWHAFAILAAVGMLRLGDWQLQRAEAGNGLSWAYAVEWPLFAALGAGFWAKTIRDELKSEPTSSPPGTPGVLDDGDPGTSAHVARLSDEVRGHGRWHGLR